MTQISCYKITHEKLAKTFCQLAEKCYYSHLPTCVFVENENYAKELDRALWTYSKKHFIPHGTNTDPMPETHPVYITCNMDMPKKYEIAILVNCDEAKILDMLSAKELLPLQKILFLYDEHHPVQHENIFSIIEKGAIKTDSINAFMQDAKGAWQEEL